MSKNNVPPKAAKVLGIGNMPPKANKVLGADGTPPKAAKVLGMGMNSGAKAMTKGVSSSKPAPKASAPKPTAFKGASPTTSGKMKPGAPIIGANRGPGASAATVNADRMKATLKKTGLM